VTIIGRVLLSTDTVPETKQVNSSKITKEVTLFSNPVFAPTAVSASSLDLSAAGNITGVKVTLG
jgi:hypothetical protein